MDFFSIATIVGTYTLIKLSSRHGLKLQFLSENSWNLILWTIIGARLASLLVNYQIYFYKFDFQTISHIFFIWDQGLSLWGAIAGFLIAFSLLCKKNEQDFWKWLDVIVPAVILALGIGHIGAFFEGVNYGHETNLPWGVNFESASIKYAVAIHPTQIYAFLYSIIISSSLIYLSHTKKIQNLKEPGFIGLLGIILYNFLRFLEEFLRGDDIQMIFSIRIPQIATLVVVITTGIFLYIKYNRPELLKRKKKWKR